ncbi:hypothetical protein QE394_001121 [Arthrobacter sp. SORGH_AS 212]|uniref:hypothetical protein n=1 Tax=Pseudarthrobacter sp. SORGH_AS 212 TaxID=3041777 RepID=UPI00278543D4|nr:hypothetical protein [Arthrobacter sp. SORGH_AS_0212]
MTAQTYPHKSGDFTIIGPECFTDESASVIAYKGENYYPQRQVKIAEELDALPVGSVVRDSLKRVFERWQLAGWQSAGPTLTSEIRLPATVLDSPRVAQ